MTTRSSGTPAKTKDVTSRKSPPPSRAKKKSESSPVTIPETRFFFFGGKGGVGKTTVACATALCLLEQARQDERILLFSTDPAHSLSDILDKKIGPRIVEVAARKRAKLFAREMDSAAALDAFKKEHGSTLARIADEGTFLDRSDINEILNLSLPGMDEVMGLFDLSETAGDGEYARIVVDTAPSGHTTRLLQLPRVFAQWINALDLIAEKHRFLIARFARRKRAQADDIELFLSELGKRLDRVREMLYKPETTAFTLVTIPEAMIVEETSRYFAFLRSEGVPITDLIINRVERPRSDCGFCGARATAQQPMLKRVRREFKGLRCHFVPQAAHAVRGQADLTEIGRRIWNASSEGELGDQLAATRGPAPGGHKPKKSIASHPDSAGLTLEPRRLLIFGGKGGVGKTTMAAAASLALAERNRRSRVLVFSTDPAHSLSDSFEENIGELKRGVAGLRNLDGIEIDPAARFQQFKERYQKWSDEWFDSLTGESGWEIQFDRDAMREIMTLAPPGIDEIAALGAISELLRDGSYSSIVLDTAPTGHLVRFLELPDIALSWVRIFMKLLLKYKAVAAEENIARELVTMSKNIKRVAALLVDSDKCEFVGVAIPERSSLEESIRLARDLERLRVPMRRLIVNNVIPSTAAKSCDWCNERRTEQQEIVHSFRRRFRAKATVFIGEQQPHEVRGPKLLREYFSSVRESTRSSK